tara:strand:- start:1539 stop:1754 length:216 start_codon:yes stop_codon:yes gene_type:complete
VVGLLRELYQLIYKRPVLDVAMRKHLSYIITLRDASFSLWEKYVEPYFFLWFILANALCAWGWVQHFAALK